MTAIITALLIAPVLLFFYLAVCAPRLEKLAVALNLIGDSAVFVDQKLPLQIAPTAADGAQASVVDIFWSVSGSPLAAVNPSLDRMSAELVCDEPADLVVSVEAKALDGSGLTASLEVKVEARPVIPTSLNLVAGDPVPRG